MHVRQPEIAARVMKRQTFVIQSKAVQQGCLQIVDVHRTVGDVKTKVVCGSKCHPRTNAAAGHPDQREQEKDD